MAAVTHDGAVGFLVIMLCTNTFLSPGLKQIFGVFIEKLQYYLKPAVATGDYIKNQFDYFIVDIIEGRISTPQGIMERALVYPPAYTAEYNTVLIAHENTGAMYLEHAMQNLNAIFPNVRQILYNGNIILHPDLRADAPRREHFMSMLGDYLDASRAYAGISETFVGLETLRRSYEQALAALELRRQLRTAQRVDSFLEPNAGADRFFLYRDYLTYGLLCGKARELGRLGDIRRWDLEHGTDYYRILFVLLSLERSFTKAAEVLHMHRNNVSYRINRIGDYININKVGAIGIIAGIVMVLAFPPSPLFVSELMILSQTITSGGWWLAAIILLLLCIVIYSVCQRMIRLCYHPNQDELHLSNINRRLSYSAFVLLLGAIVLGLWQPQSLVALIDKIAIF